MDAERQRKCAHMDIANPRVVEKGGGKVVRHDE
jgi:hypothetical protein